MRELRERERELFQGQEDGMPKLPPTNLIKSINLVTQKRESDTANHLFVHDAMSFRAIAPGRRKSQCKDRPVPESRIHMKGNDFSVLVDAHESCTETLSTKMQQRQHTVSTVEKRHSKGI